jgi:hypothetical protein
MWSLASRKKEREKSTYRRKKEVDPLHSGPNGLDPGQRKAYI